ncbi:uncharacterized protein LACBIDRAFT_315573 [Laccaria bicolor S238N-H82]|uniref:Predicted protein n=1 Tax=Laccaria bicolor (strain S238N-H82 / ATCC MYA-4686) TaxID=486041 RepID=B0D2N7_LACBS|nr:uncharacterized protein LACBIDRAFT_315573 [Laccaria bicolor S238N-H82]EDR11128.1 predicted protein [Laccaria bicolor S238N-H82]|eukprot:XP_001878429.1 predicted protein [Laccaria bicolor S238N-H82]
MSLSQLHLPSFTVVLTSDHGSTILRDYQRAQSREIQIPIFRPEDDGLLDTMDMRTPTGFIVYRCEYARDQDTATLFGDDVQTADPKASIKGVLQGFGTQVDSCSSRSSSDVVVDECRFVFPPFYLVLVHRYLIIAIFVVIEKNRPSRSFNSPNLFIV